MPDYIPENGRLFWPGSAASIPAGWSRDTDFDDRYLAGLDNTFTGSTNGGSATHDHSPVVHQHPNSGLHRHTISGASSTGSVAFLSIGGTSYPQFTHSHGSVYSPYSEANLSASIGLTINAVTARPPSVRMIVIKPDDASQQVPDDAICFTDESSAPTGFHITDGAGGTTDYDGKFIIGAEAAGDGGGTLGSADHKHTTSAHDHWLVAHTHAEDVTANGSPTRSATPSVGAIDVRELMHHRISLDSFSGQKSDTASPETSDVSNYPAYVDLLGIQNTSGSSILPADIIIPFTDDWNNIPSGWEHVSSTEFKQVRITKTPGNIGNTGGSNTHTHTGDNHNHGYSSHTHSETVSDLAVVGRNSGAARQVLRSTAHTHVWTIGSGTPANSSFNTFNMSTDSILYTYRTVLFIKKVTVGAVVKDIISSKGVVAYAR